MANRDANDITGRCGVISFAPHSKANLDQVHWLFAELPTQKLVVDPSSIIVSDITLPERHSQCGHK